MVDLSRIDWQRVVLDIRKYGLSLAQASRKIGCDESVLQRWARGDAVRMDWKLALPLLDLHYDLCPEEHRLERIAL